MSEAILVKGSYSESNTKTLVFKEVKIPTSAWEKYITNPTKDDVYIYRATAVCTGLTSDYIPEVIFDMANATSGDFAPVCESGTGAITIYARKIPEKEISFTVKATLEI